MNKKLDLLIPEAQRPQPSSPPSQPSRTLSYTAWNEAQGSTVNWTDYEDVTSGPSRPHGKQPAEPSDESSDYVDEHGVSSSDFS